MDFEENIDPVVHKNEDLISDVEQDENEYQIKDNLIYFRNDLLISRIVYQCIDCIRVFDTITDSHIHYKQSHQNNNKSNDGINSKINLNSDQREENNFLKNKMREKFNEIKQKKNKSKTDDNLINLSTKLVNNKNLKISESQTNVDFDDNINRNNKIKKSEKNSLKLGQKGLYKITGKLFKCQECGKSYATQKILNTHNRMHTNPVECPFLDCGRKFPFVSLMKIHYLVHTNESRFKCDWPGCDYATVHQAGIIAHKRTHTGEKPYKCCWPQCNKQFTQQSSLNSHISYKHDKEIVKRFACEWPGCDAKFIFMNQLKKHHRSHTGERPFHCDWPNCEMKFTNSTVLKRHRVTHTGERPYHCDWPGCEAKFGASGTLNTHKKLVHKCDYIKRSRWDNKKKKL